MGPLKKDTPGPELNADDCVNLDTMTATYLIYQSEGA
jgi:hypothetical protein